MHTLCPRPGHVKNSLHVPWGFRWSVPIPVRCRRRGGNIGPERELRAPDGRVPEIPLAKRDRAMPR